MHDFSSILEKLRLAQLNFLRAADTVDSSFWLTSHKTGCWSAAELVAHLCQVERGVLAYADRVIRKEPLPVPYYQRFHLPLFMVEVRLIRRKTPIPLDPELLSGKETMLAELRGVREHTFAFLEETRGRDLVAYYWPHPFLGRLNFYEWFVMVASHEIRHTSQMAEISKNLPNRVATSLS
jgi:hypothetical protein